MTSTQHSAFSAICISRTHATGDMLWKRLERALAPSAIGMSARYPAAFRPANSDRALFPRASRASVSAI